MYTSPVLPTNYSPRKELVGRFSVDTGMVLIGDPVNWLFTTPRAVGGSWEKFCEKLRDAGQPDSLEVPFEKNPTGNAGILISGFGGDGTFPVYIERDESGLVVSLTVEFRRGAQVRNAGDRG